MLQYNCFHYMDYNYWYRLHYQHSTSWGTVQEQHSYHVDHVRIPRHIGTEEHRRYHRHVQWYREQSKLAPYSSYHIVDRFRLPSNSNEDRHFSGHIFLRKIKYKFSRGYDVNETTPDRVAYLASSPDCTTKCLVIDHAGKGRIVLPSSFR